MAVSPVPEGYRMVTPYLVVADGEGLLAFLRSAFQAEVVSRSVRPDGSIANAEVRVGDSMVMLAEAREPWKPMPTGFYLYVPDTDAVYRAALAAGGGFPHGTLGSVLRRPQRRRAGPLGQQLVDRHPHRGCGRDRDPAAPGGPRLSPGG